ncbi:hypothetical protein J5N97_010347 [Dioscorea zingiberensis]|uniref:Uncharacterized protein n=1 Tax=Dioscorea zingiberensis TaxID=325984 RepID=A0A9D5D0H0_9LILI|nr:hypothetical protein J5N97_010347 [Dioscorea zingiberensis]
MQFSFSLLPRGDNEEIEDVSSDKDASFSDWEGDEKGEAPEETTDEVRYSIAKEYLQKIPGCLDAVVTFTRYPVKRLSRFKILAVVEEDDGPKWWEKNVGPNMIDVHLTQ